MKTFLDFERPVAELANKIEELRHLSDIGDINIADEVGKLQNEADRLLKHAYANLTRWQKVQVARHPERRERVITTSGQEGGRPDSAPDNASTARARAMRVPAERATARVAHPPPLLAPHPTNPALRCPGGPKIIASDQLPSASPFLVAVSAENLGWLAYRYRSCAWT